MSSNPKGDSPSIYNHAAAPLQLERQPSTSKSRADESIESTLEPFVHEPYVHRDVDYTSLARQALAATRSQESEARLPSFSTLFADIINNVTEEPCSKIPQPEQRLAGTITTAPTVEASDSSTSFNYPQAKQLTPGTPRPVQNTNMSNDEFWYLYSQDRTVNINASHRFICVGCDAQFKDFGRLAIHETYHHAGLRANPQRPVIPNGYPCQKCGKLFSRGRDIANHEKGCYKRLVQYPEDWAQFLVQNPGIRRYVTAVNPLCCPFDNCYNNRTVYSRTGAPASFLKHILCEHDELIDVFNARY